MLAGRLVVAGAHVEVRHIRRLVHERRIPFIKWGHLLRFDPVAVMAWLEECRYEPLRRAV